MTDSMSLITAQVAFLDAELVLIHVPIEQYPIYLQPILRLLFGEDHDEDNADIPWTNRHEFLNLSITPLECTIICSKCLAEKYFVRVQKTLQTLSRTNKTIKDNFTIYQELYTVIQVDGQGLDAGQRVLELTGPLAMAGISIFFITTYFCDYVLVPTKARRAVTLALEQRGFVFSQEEDAFISQLSPSLNHHNQLRPTSSSSEDSGIAERHDSPSVPPTPPAKDINELQTRTFKKLKRYGVKFLGDESLRLVSCAGSREPDTKKDEKLRNDLLQVLLAGPTIRHVEADDIDDDDDNEETSNSSPSFLSLTITSFEPISVLFEERLLPRLGKSLYGAKSSDDVLVPIMFDLRDLAFETTGIVGGVAGRLSQQQQQQQQRGNHEGLSMSELDLSPTMSPSDESSSDSSAAAAEISFLSTAKAGTVIVKANQVGRAIKLLNQALEETLVEKE